MRRRFQHINGGVVRLHIAPPRPCGSDAEINDRVSLRVRLQATHSRSKSVAQCQHSQTRLWHVTPRTLVQFGCA